MFLMVFLCSVRFAVVAVRCSLSRELAIGWRGGRYTIFSFIILVILNGQRSALAADFLAVMPLIDGVV